jgi:hypothetical protein
MNLTRERIAEALKEVQKCYDFGDGQIPVPLQTKIDRILAELEPEPEKSFESAQDKPKTLEDYLSEVFPLWQWRCPNFLDLKEAVKKWLASKPKKMTVEQLLDELEKEEKG